VIDEKQLIQCPPNAGSEYYNYKGFPSILLQAASDAKAKFIALCMVIMDDIVIVVFLKNPISENY